MAKTKQRKVTKSDSSQVSQLKLTSKRPECKLRPSRLERSQTAKTMCNLRLLATSKLYTCLAFSRFEENEGLGCSILGSLRAMSTEQCELIRQLASHVPYQSLITAKFVIAVLGACGICYQWRKQGVRFLAHNNTKILFKFYYALNLFYATVCVSSYLFELVRGMIISSGVSAHNIIMIISFERLYSVLFPGRFEKQSNTKLMFCMALIVILTTWTIVMFSLSDGFTLFGDRIVPFLEDRTEANRSSFAKVALWVTISNVLSPAIFSLDLYINFLRTSTQSSSSLSIAYQRKENRRVILIILPIEITETLLGFSTTCAILLRDKFVDMKIPLERMFFLESSTFTMLFPLILAIIIECRVARRKRAVVPVEDDDVKATRDHFDSLRLAWQ